MKFENINEVYIKWQKDLDNAILGEIKQKAVEHGIKTEYVLNEKAIISALKKQIPKKRADGWYGKNTECPICHIVASNKYCPNCGQALEEGDCG